MNTLNAQSSDEDVNFMNQVVIEKDKLLVVLKENKAKHDEILTEALKGYWDLATEKLQKKKKEFEAALKDVQDDFNHLISKVENRINEKEKFDDLMVVGLYFKYNKDLELKYPEDHSRDYDKAIRLVEMSAYDKISLNEDEFNRYVMNDWEWKSSFLVSNSAYYNHAISGDAGSLAKGGEFVFSRSKLDNLKKF
jgi:hypothetical protein